MTDVKDDLVFKVLVGTLRERKAALMEFAKECWLRGWDDCWEATQEAMAEVSLTMPEPPKGRYVQ